VQFQAADAGGFSTTQKQINHEWTRMNTNKQMANGKWQMAKLGRVGLMADSNRLRLYNALDGVHDNQSRDAGDRSV
jgi:hypothetical protein